MFPSPISILILMSLINVAKPDQIKAKIDFFFVFQASNHVMDDEIQLMNQFLKSWPDHFKVSESDSKIAVFMYGTYVHDKQKLTADEPRVRKMNLTGSYVRTDSSVNTHDAFIHDKGVMKVDKEKGRTDALKIVILVTKSQPADEKSTLKIGKEMTDKGMVIYTIFVGGPEPTIETAFGKENVVYKSSYADAFSSASIADFVQKVACTFQEVCNFQGDKCVNDFGRPIAADESKCTNTKPTAIPNSKDCTQPNACSVGPKAKGDGGSKEKPASSGLEGWAIGVIVVVVVVVLIVIVVVAVVIIRKKKQNDGPKEKMGDGSIKSGKSNKEKPEGKSIKSDKKMESGKSQVDAKKSTVTPQG